MAAPWTYGTPGNLTYGPNSGSDHLGSLANGSAVVIDWNNLSAGAVPVDITYSPIALTVAGAAAGTMTLLAIFSLDGTNNTDLILSTDITGGTNIAAKLATAPIVSVINTVTSAQFSFAPFSLMSIWNGLVVPQYGGLVLLNNSGGAVAATSGTNNVATKSLTPFA